MSLPAVIAGLPEWFLLGVVIGAALTVLFAAVFFFGELFVDDGQRDGSAQRVDGEKRRTGEIRQYLDAIDEPYLEGHAVGGHEVAFFLPERDVAITFDARAFFGLEETAVHTILCEYEMPPSALANRLPFETPELDAPAESGPSVPAETKTAFRELGLSPGADPRRVQVAYRRRVKDVHPDHGGDEESFKRVQDAYTTAREYAERAS